MYLKQLYKKTILEHNRNPRNIGKPKVYTHMAEGLNAICGDQVIIYINIIDNMITTINFDGESCAISRASSSIMTEFLMGKSIDQAQSHFKDFCHLMDKKNNVLEIESLAEVNAIAGVKKFPARIKSATLCWHAMNAAIEGVVTTTTE